MCYSAQIEKEWLRYRRVTGGDLSLKDYARIYWSRQKGLPFRIPKMFDRWFNGIAGEEAEEIRHLIAEWNADQIQQFEQQAFASRKRVSDAERALTVKVTKKAEDDVRIGKNKLKQALRKLEELKRIDTLPEDGRIFPGWYAPVLIAEDGQRMIKPMRYQCRPAGKPAFYDTKYPGTYNARRDNLTGFWKGQFGHTHALTVVRKFYENVDRDGQNAILEFSPDDGEEMLVACLYSRWVGDDGEELWSFAAITDDPPAEVREAGHDRCIIPIKAANIDAWLNPDPADLQAQFAILDDRQRPYYEHRLAA